MANEKRLKLIEYDVIRNLFDEEYRKTAQLIRDGETHLDNLAEGFTEADRVIWKLPNVDAVEVVRCRDCAKDGLTTCPLCWIENHTLNFVNHDPNFYCGAAERRTDND